jgi:hypothetical protein
LANSISLRSSLNDQGLRAITDMILYASTQRQSRQADPYSLSGFAWVGPGLGGARCGDGYAIGETSQQTTPIKLTPQPYRDEVGAYCSVQPREFP